MMTTRRAAKEKQHGGKMILRKLPNSKDEKSSPDKKKPEKQKECHPESPCLPQSESPQQETTPSRKEPLPTKETNLQDSEKKDETDPTKPAEAPTIVATPAVASTHNNLEEFSKTNFKLSPKPGDTVASPGDEPVKKRRMKGLPNLLVRKHERNEAETNEKPSELDNLRVHARITLSEPKLHMHTQQISVVPVTRDVGEEQTYKLMLNNTNSSASFLHARHSAESTDKANKVLSPNKVPLMPIKVVKSNPDVQPTILKSVFPAPPLIATSAAPATTTTSTTSKSSNLPYIFIHSHQNTSNAAISLVQHNLPKLMTAIGQQQQTGNRNVNLMLINANQSGELKRRKIVPTTSAPNIIHPSNTKLTLKVLNKKPMEPVFVPKTSGESGNKESELKCTSPSGVPDSSTADKGDSASDPFLELPALIPFDKPHVSEEKQKLIQQKLDPGELKISKPPVSDGKASEMSDPKATTPTSVLVNMADNSIQQAKPDDAQFIKKHQILLKSSAPNFPARKMETCLKNPQNSRGKVVLSKSAKVTGLPAWPCKECDAEQVLNAHVEELDRLRAENKKLRDLNAALQSKLKIIYQLPQSQQRQEELLMRILDQIPLMAGILPALPDGNATGTPIFPPVATLINNEVHLGQGVWLAKREFDRVMNIATTPSLLVRNLGVAVYGEDVLKTSSVLGKPCMRFTNRSSRPPLSPTRFTAIRETFDYWLTKHGYSGQRKLDELSHTTQYLGSKIQDLNRPEHLKYKYRRNKKKTEEEALEVASLEGSQDSGQGDLAKLDSDKPPELDPKPQASTSQAEEPVASNSVLKKKAAPKRTRGSGNPRRKKKKIEPFPPEWNTDVDDWETTSSQDIMPFIKHEPMSDEDYEGDMIDAVPVDSPRTSQSFSVKAFFDSLTKDLEND